MNKIITEAYNIEQDSDKDSTHQENLYTYDPNDESRNDEI